MEWRNLSEEEVTWVRQRQKRKGIRRSRVGAQPEVQQAIQIQAV